MVGREERNASVDAQWKVMRDPSGDFLMADWHWESV